MSIIKRLLKQIQHVLHDLLKSSNHDSLHTGKPWTQAMNEEQLCTEFSLTRSDYHETSRESPREGHD